MLGIFGDMFAIFHIGLLTKGFLKKSAEESERKRGSIKESKAYYYDRNYRLRLTSTDELVHVRYNKFGEKMLYNQYELPVYNFNTEECEPLREKYKSEADRSKRKVYKCEKSECGLPAFYNTFRLFDNENYIVKIYKYEIFYLYMDINTHKIIDTTEATDKFNKVLVENTKFYLDKEYLINYLNTDEKIYERRNYENHYSTFERDMEIADEKAMLFKNEAVALEYKDIIKER